MRDGVPTRREATRQLFFWSLNRLGLLSGALLCLSGIFYILG
ncbi:hypothetical protein MicloDRAFT_00004240 [Microvirga lotononidis]|uniref:Uncharacterized protein n=1 Tax=Microvirga lotononidis TaxID=864069 RepID=I4Z1Q1_9HYPH|nr:hypothetical protein MicloDRAFT_00014640 [Microvirga lotononidis]EIM30897.1 hypothetical protein MicloDRAFT_00004240 [Microvirga lotononidis]